MGEIITSFVLVFLAFILKLVIDRTCNRLNLGMALLEFPVDMLFASFAFLGTYILLANKKFTTLVAEGKATSLPFFLTLQGGFSLCMLYIILIVIVIFCWRRAERLLTQHKKWRSLGMAILNYLFSITGIVVLILMISEVIK